ncbi:4Fe-4S ferredoxin [Thermoflexales bacterium]|nr:4Fe-4S ferredoxin [Thermoflexales bacterium]
MMYLDAIALVRTLPCLAEPGKIIVIGKPNRSLAEVLPYLATLPGILAYNPEAHTLTFRRPMGFMTLYADRVYITQLKSADEGLELLAALQEAINATWEHRAELIAVTVGRRAPRPFDVWTLLPQTNCKLCGEATCLAFAVGLLQHKRSVLECPPLQADGSLTDRRATLEAMF